MAILDKIQSTKEIYSLNDSSEILLGSVIGGQSESIELMKCKREFFLGDLAPQLFDVLVKLHTENEFVDYISVIERLAKDIGSEKAKTYVDLIVSKVPQEFSPSATIAILEKGYIQREAISILDVARRRIQLNPENSPEIMFDAQDKVDRLTSMTVDFKLSDSLEKTSDEIMSGDFDKFIIKTGWRDVDKVIGGLTTQEVSIWGARPGHCKTTSSVALARSVLTANPKIKILKFELEMSMRAMNSKMIAAESGVSSYGIRTNQLSEQDKEKIINAVQTLKRFDDRLFIFDNVYDFHTMTKMARALDAGLVMVDYIALMDGVEEDKRNELGRIAKYAKRDAKAHNRHWLFYSQLNRGPELRENHAPTAGDIGESDQLGHIASEIILLYYAYKYTFDKVKDEHHLRLLFDKSRYSSIGEAKLYLDADKIILRDI